LLTGRRLCEGPHNLKAKRVAEMDVDDLMELCRQAAIIDLTAYESRDRG
jgi:hypothetical protein